MQESLVKEFKESMEKALVPSEEAATAEGKAALADRLAWFEQVRDRLSQDFHSSVESC